MSESAVPNGTPTTAGLRSIYDRMTKPTSGDLEVNARLQTLSRTELERIINHFGMAMEHMAAQREDLAVKRTQDATGWTIRIDITPNVPSPVNFGANGA